MNRVGTNFSIVTGVPNCGYDIRHILVPCGRVSNRGTSAKPELINSAGRKKKADFARPQLSGTAMKKASDPSAVKRNRPSNPGFSSLAPSMIALI